MATFLSWLYGKANSVRDFFNWGWTSTLNVINNVNAWVASARNTAYAWARTYADNLQTIIYSWTNSAIAWVNVQWKYAINVVNVGLTTAKSYLEGLITWGINTLRDFLIDTFTFTYGILNQAKLYSNGLIDGLRASLIALMASLTGSFTPYLKLLQDLTTLLSTTGLAKLTDFLNRMYYSLVDFTKDPMGYVLSFVWVRFQEMLCYALAYGLGTVEATLPPLPVWGMSGAGGPTLAPGGAVIGIGELMSPLSSLYVSGYPFRTGHPGLDLAIVDGQEVHACHDGIVLVSGWSDVGYGFTVVIQGGKWWSRYAHLKQPLVSPGENVQAGQVIGYGNSTGNSTGPHLHLEIKEFGQFVDPAILLGLGG